MLLIVPRLHAPSIDIVMRHFAKLQVDEQPSIRTNTTICLGKIAKSIPQATRDRVLIPAFLRVSIMGFVRVVCAVYVLGCIFL